MIHHETYGAGDPLMLITGLGGVGRAWGEVIDLFAQDFLTIVPDHPGTGQSSIPDHFTIADHANSIAAVLRDLSCGPTHLVGSSTGGAIAQVMAIDHRDVVRSIVMADSWKKADGYFRHQFAIRKQILLEQGTLAYTEASALFLFGATYFQEHRDEVEKWIQRAGGTSAEIMAKRIDMILAFDESDRLDQIDVPALALVGEEDICTPPYMSQQLADAIPNADMKVIPGGHLVYKENPELFFETVKAFVR